MPPSGAAAPETGRETMGIRIVRLGAARQPGEGPRFATVRRPPRGVRREDYARRDYFDLWLPELAPSAPLLSYAKSQPLTPARWQTFARRYRSEMRTPGATRLLATLSALSAQANFSVGCYCPDESRCHRSLLRQLLVEAGATVL
ncbi:MAG: hypothetical protein QOK27_2544 [Gemmatimonadales bacterium]|nr:hypothetical protein [Gemmatimonadales bacterium]